jgi:hypothetical protein
VSNQSTKTVVILGAGATLGSGFTKCDKHLPGDRGFFGHDLVRANVKNYPAVDLMLDLFFRTGDLSQASLEDVWTFTEFCSKATYSSSISLAGAKEEWLNRIRDLSSQRIAEHCQAKEFRESNTIPPDLGRMDMPLLAGWDLRCLFSDVFGEVKPPVDENPYTRLLTNYSVSLNSNTTFISLNYDTVLEHGLVSVPWHYPHITTAVRRDTNGIRILKPHGSLNWLFKGNVPNVPKVEITTDYTLEPVPHRSFEPNHFEEAAIIPPTQLKQTLNVAETQDFETRRLFGRIWTGTRDALVEAERVFIIGYSFPDTDHHIRTVLRLVNGMRNKPYGEVYCCTMAEDGLERKVFENVVKFFPSDSDYHRSDAGFEVFAKGV